MPTLLLSGGRECSCTARGGFESSENVIFWQNWRQTLPLVLWHLAEAILDGGLSLREEAAQEREAGEREQFRLEEVTKKGRVPRPLMEIHQLPAE